MKVATLGESTADEAATRILADGVLGVQTEVVALHPRLRPGGWPSVATVLPSILLHLYFRTDAEALVLVVDSNDSPVHQANGAHIQRAATTHTCRLCELRGIITKIQRELPPLTGRRPIKTAVGIAVPAIEGWFQVGVNGAVTEAAWIKGIQSGTHPYTRNQLKQAVYGTDRPSLVLETRRATEEAQRLAAGGLDAVEHSYPNGFGALAADLRGW